MAVDKKTIIDGVSQLDVHGNEKGLIPAFGVYLTNSPAHFFNRLSFNFERSFPEDAYTISRELLVNAAWQCGYHTFHGIQTSVEWESLIAPMVQNADDKLYASAAVAQALGWVKWDIVELQSGVRAVFEATAGYEAELYIEEYHKSHHPISYMILGVAGALMDLSYGDYYPAGIFTFKSEQTQCTAMGDAVSRIIVTRR